MASKRKKAGTDSRANLAFDTMRDLMPRRSSRRALADGATQGNGDDGQPDVSGSQLDKDMVRTTGRSWKPKEEVQRAVQELGEMEERLQSATKRQRLAVESSALAVAEDESGQGKIFAAGRAHSRKEVVNDKVEEEKSGTPDLETAPVPGRAGELAAGDVQQAKEDEEAAAEEDGVPDRGAARRPPVHSDYLPLPWKGRLGYACLNTYLRAANPPVFSSRTCRISSILEHRHPLEDPSQPEHPRKNRPVRNKPADVNLGMKFVQSLGLSNARDIIKMVRWNDRFGIKFMRLSSEMFPFASHEEYGYKLAPFASDVLAEAGRVAAELGHRLTTHPGQFTQLGSPRREVIEAAFRDLEYHDEMLSLLKLPDELDRDAIMILHMGGTYGDKPATIRRFRENYARLPASVKRRLVLENDDVAWSVHDLLPVCEELNIPLVLDFHHHNIVFDSSKVREGTADIVPLFARIAKTWTRKGIRQKMHYSEQTQGASTARERRKHSARVRTLPPCAPNMDLMIEAKDKEQAVFELMRAFKLPGWNTFNDVIPYEREDEIREKKVAKRAKSSRKSKLEDGNEDESEGVERAVAEEDIGMGGPDGRVFWPEGMEEWLKPKKRETRKN